MKFRRTCELYNDIHKIREFRNERGDLKKLARQESGEKMNMTLRYNIDNGPGSGMGPSLLDRSIKFLTSPSIEIPTSSRLTQYFSEMIAAMNYEFPWNSIYKLANRRNNKKDESVTLITLGPES
ncbi:MAG: hypothetical protein ACFFF4_13400 [Candidatus Thorarchaeota archaeon]